MLSVAARRSEVTVDSSVHAGRRYLLADMCLSVALVDCDRVGWNTYRNNFTIS